MFDDKRDAETRSRDPSFQGWNDEPIENTLTEAELVATSEINQRGGIVLKDRVYKVETIEEDGGSDPETFALKAKQLLDSDKVAVAFGGWTSSSRKAMIPVFETRNKFLYYAVQYESEKCNLNILYAGSVFNQQAAPAIELHLRTKGETLFLVGSDYIYPARVNAQIRATFSAKGQIVGKSYCPLGSRNMTAFVCTIRRQMPKGDIIVDTLNVVSNVSIYRELTVQRLKATRGYTVMSFAFQRKKWLPSDRRPCMAAMPLGASLRV